ncbi:hypothetical protein WJX73_007206 [Symbiochloris irregularis]|uniref:Uncharacterized protein n=1 Tax=Symbiochloris irregularis TaxID=706552 RepID=A0AAW1NZA7_9CHLO
MNRVHRLSSRNSSSLAPATGAVLTAFKLEWQNSRGQISASSETALNLPVAVTIAVGGMGQPCRTEEKPQLLYSPAGLPPALHLHPHLAHADVHSKDEEHRLAYPVAERDLIQAHREAAHMEGRPDELSLHECLPDAADDINRKGHVASGLPRALYEEDTLEDLHLPSYLQSCNLGISVDLLTPSLDPDCGEAWDDYCISFSSGGGSGLLPRWIPALS